MIEFASKKESERMVDALDEGCIVRVSESYARNEGLPILRLIQDSSVNEEAKALARSKENLDRVKIAPFDSLRKPLKKNENNILSSLKENFHWSIIQQRRNRGISRKQFASALGVSENEVKMLENGVLPAEDFVLIGGVERYFGISLRRDGSRYVAPTIEELRAKNLERAKEKQEEAKKAEKKAEVLRDDELFSNDLDLFEDK